MITVTVSAANGEMLATAEAADPEAALVAARTLWDDEQAAYAPYYRKGLVVRFAVGGTTILATERRPS